MAETAEAITAGPAKAAEAVAQAVGDADELSPSTIITALVLIAIVLALIIAAQVYMRYKEEMGYESETEEE